MAGGLKWMRQRISGRLAGVGGFTLLEVMVALVVLGVGLVTVIQLFSGALSSVERAFRHTQVAFLALEKLDEVLADTELAPGEGEGSFPEPFEDYRWRVSVAEVEEEAADEEAEEEKTGKAEAKEVVARQLRVEVEVLWQMGDEAGRQGRFKLVTLKSYLVGGEEGL